MEGLAGQRILVTSMTVPRSDGDETGKDNSGRAEGVLESVGFKHIYKLLVTSMINSFNIAHEIFSP